MLKQVSIVAVATAMGAMGAGITGTLAADLPARVYTKAPVMAPAYNWTGFYLGVNAGLGVGRNQTSYVNAPNPAFFASSSYLGPIGAIGGGQLGYNWQVNNWVLGLETDIQASGIRENIYCGILCTVGSALRYDQKLNWFGTARARAGVTNGPVFSYVTGGFAYGGVQTDASVVIGAQTLFSVRDTRTGWTYGSGVEASLGGNWTGKIEYLYLHMGSQRGTTNVLGQTQAFASDIREHIFRAGVNYRIGGNASYAPPPVANWTGFYLGGNGGSALARNKTNLLLNPAAAANETFTLMPSGFIGGAQAGYNWQSAKWVLGLEADIQGSTQRDDRNCNLSCFQALTQNFTNDQRMTWLGTVRGRLGYSVGSTLFYGTGGFAYGGITNNVSERIGVATLAAKFKHSKSGWTAGGGMETPLDFFGLLGKNWTGKTEYLYVDLGRTTDSFTLSGFDHTLTSRVTEHVFRSGLNYHFNAPVIAKY